MKKLNKKGFTLIEIIVVLMIATIVMVMASSLILNSMGYFDKTAVSDSDKQATDSISKFVGDELMFASEVKIDTKAPDGSDWHYFAVNENRLYRDEQAVFDNSFYRQRNLNMKARGYDSYRLDVTSMFVDKDNETVYKTKNTLELINLRMYKETTDKTFDPFSAFSTEVEIKDKGGYRIYYKLGNLAVKEASEIITTGTIEDEINCKNIDDGINNNRGQFKKDTLYINGDFVYTGSAVAADEDKRIWYRYVEVGKNSEKMSDPLAMGGWKQLSEKWINKSSYLINDIIKGNDDEYYQCIKNIRTKGLSTEDTNPTSGANKLLYWVKIDKEKLETDRDYKKFCDSSLNRDNSSIEGESYRCMNDDNNKGEFKKFNVAGAPRVEYKAGDFVLYKSIWYRAYKKTDNTIAPDENNPEITKNWRKLDINYDNNIDRMYLKTDVVKFEKKYYQAKEDIPLKSSPTQKPELWTKGYHSVAQLELSAEYKEVVCSEYKDDEKPPVGDITVGGEYRRCGNSSNFKGELVLDSKPVSFYTKGDFISYQGVYYRVISGGANSNMDPTDEARVGFFKKITDEYTVGSKYYKGDIVISEGKYYQLTMVNSILAIKGTKPGDFSATGIRWAYGYDSLEDLVKGRVAEGGQEFIPVSPATCNDFLDYK